jgi:hypothetical protein
MPDDSLHQPHDKLFRATFPDPANAAAFLRTNLSGTFPSFVDWDSTRSIPRTFVAPHRSGLEADLLFSAKVGETDTLFYLLWEHQRTEDPHMRLLLLVPMARVWQKQCENQKSNVRLRPVLPLVLAQDKGFPCLQGFGLRQGISGKRSGPAISVREVWVRRHSQVGRCERRRRSPV